MRAIVQAEEKDKEEILRLYKTQLGREFCPWDETYPGEKEIEFDLSRDALFVMKDEKGKIIRTKKKRETITFLEYAQRMHDIALDKRDEISNAKKIFCDKLPSKFIFENELYFIFKL